MIATRDEIERAGAPGAPGALGDCETGYSVAPRFSQRETARILGVCPTVVGQLEDAARFKFCAGLLASLVADPLHGEESGDRLMMELLADRDMQLLFGAAELYRGDAGAMRTLDDRLAALEREAIELDNPEPDAQRIDEVAQLWLFPELVAPFG